MAYDEFVDLDEIVPGTGFKKKTEEQKKEAKLNAQEQSGTQEPAPSEKQKPKAPPKKAEDLLKDDEPEQEAPKEKEEKKEQSEEPKQKEEPQKKEKPKPVQEKKPVVKVQKKEEVPVKKEEKSSLKKAMSLSKKRRAQARAAKEEKKALKAQKSSKSSDKKETNWVVVALIILAAIVVGIIIYMALKFDFSGSNQESIVAVVNGEPIYKSEISNRYNLLTSTMDPFITQEQVLNLSITDKLLLQEAAKKGIKTSDEEVDALLKDIMIQNNIDEASLKQDLESKNVSYDFLINLYKNTLTVNKLINQSFSNVEVSDEEIKDFYELNKEALTIPDRARVRHILFMYGTGSENETYTKAVEVQKQIKEDKANFCGLVSSYSEDTASISSCGEYNISIQDPLLPEFIEAAFTMKKGEIRLVKTQIGYHIMYKIEDIPGYVPSVSEVKSQLSSIILEDKTVEGLQKLISDLQSKAIIEIYNENISTKRFKELTAEKIVKEEVSAPESQSEEENGEELPAVIETESSSNGQEVVFSKEVVNTPSSQKFLLATCLADNGHRMFTASWSPDSKAQLDLFEEYASHLVIVECDPESKLANIQECSNVLKKQYPTWPTWEIDGELYEGVQSLAALSRYSGCPYQG